MLGNINVFVTIIVLSVTESLGVFSGDHWTVLHLSQQNATAVLSDWKRGLAYSVRLVCLVFHQDCIIDVY